MTSPIKCFVTFRLQPGVTAEAFEQWFRTENVAAVAHMTVIEDYRLWRRERVHEGTPVWEFIEEMAVLDLEACQREFDELPAMREMQDAWRAMVADQAVVFVTEVAKS